MLDGTLEGFDLLGIQESTIYDPDRAYAEFGGSRYSLIVGMRSTGYALDWTPSAPAGETVTVAPKKLPFCKIGKELKERVDYGDI